MHVKLKQLEYHSEVHLLYYILHGINKSIILKMEISDL